MPQKGRFEPFVKHVGGLAVDISKRNLKRLLVIFVVWPGCGPKIAQKTRFDNFNDLAPDMGNLFCRLLALAFSVS